MSLGMHYALWDQYRAQGGTQSIEDAGVLEICLIGLKEKDELSRRLQLFQRLRVPRYATIQMASTVRQDDPNPEYNYQRVLEQSRKWHDGLDQPHRKVYGPVSKFRAEKC